MEADKIALSEKFGRPIPTEILNKPTLDPRLYYVLEAFYRLDTERTHKDGVTRIPWTSIVKYAEYYNIPESISEEFIYLIERIDAVNVERIQAQMDRDAAKAEKEAKAKSKAGRR